MWSESAILSWGAFTQQILDPYMAATRPLSRTYVFRGQANHCWTLEPTLTRLARVLGYARQDALQLEGLLLDRFRERAHLHLESRYMPTGFGTLLQSTGRLEWWSLMQHYRAPTRLLDWTHSPLVALYFASNDLWETDGAIWMVQRRWLHERGKEVYGPVPQDAATMWSGDDPPRRMLGFDPSRPTDRMAAQQGSFTVCQDILLDHADGIEWQLPDVETESEGRSVLNRHKYIIPADLKFEFLRNLHHMNVTAAALFPGIDGVGAELVEMVRLRGRASV